MAKVLPTPWQIWPTIRPLRYGPLGQTRRFACSYRLCRLEGPLLAAARRHWGAYRQPSPICGPVPRLPPKHDLVVKFKRLSPREMQISR